MTRGESQFWTYILENAAGRFYIGSTDDLDRRVAEHNDPDRSRSKYTVKHGPWKLIWSESHRSRAEARARETQIKKMKSARWIRERLLSSVVERVPARRD
ncbi:MAG: GIY-YIG nuclease family protein [Planctomycetes bacterium]|nr:GIY-YIG nuclease family protein [Planctomycetota bacterium]